MEKLNETSLQSSEKIFANYLMMTLEKKVDNKKLGSSPLVPPSLVGTNHCTPQKHFHILYNDLVCNNMCSITEGCIRYWGHKRKNPKHKLC